jgi:hypothetical protein
MKLFVVNGIEKTTIRQIADEIEYSVGSVYINSPLRVFCFKRLNFPTLER